MSAIDKRRVPVRGGELAVVEAGDPDSPAVVLIHGDLTSSYLWRHLVPMLAPWTRVIAPDLPGHGDSTTTAADPTLAGRAGVARELLAALGVERFAAIGHAAGGAIAQLLAVDGSVDAMVLIDTFAPGVPPTPVEQAGEATTIDAVRRLLEVGMSHRERLSDDDRREYVRPFEGGDPRRWTPDSEGPPPDLEPRLSELEIPVFVLWGEDDAIVDAAAAERLGQTLPWATVALLPGCGHLLLEDAPETVAPLIFQWLRSQYLKVEHHHETGPVAVYLGRRPPGEGG